MLSRGARPTPGPFLGHSIGRPLLRSEFLLIYAYHVSQSSTESVARRWSVAWSRTSTVVDWLAVSNVETLIIRNYIGFQLLCSSIVITNLPLVRVEFTPHYCLYFRNRFTCLQDQVEITLCHLSTCSQNFKLHRPTTRLLYWTRPLEMQDLLLTLLLIEWWKCLTN